MTFSGLDVLLADNDLDSLPRVAVIIPVYNDATGLLKCLEGLAFQTYPGHLIEIVVIDNGSTPPLNLHDALLNARVEHCITPGSYAARNAGVRVATGTVLAFTDADCIPHPSWIESGVRALSAADGPHLVGGRVEIIEPAKRTGTGLYQYACGFPQEQNIAQKGFVATANLFCLSRHFQAVGPFDERLLSGGDAEWAWRATRQGFKIVYEPEALVSTPPRISLRSAIRQARRVTAGRRHLKEHGLTGTKSGTTKPYPTSMDAMRWILTRPQFSWWERLRILAAAVSIKLATIIEQLRLGFGASAERG